MRPRVAVLLVLFGSFLPFAGSAFGASKDTHAAAPFSSAPPRPAAAPMIPAGAATGMCQCISDHDRRHIGCLASVEACQSSCGNSRYSFVPSAPSCPVTAGGQ